MANQKVAKEIRENVAVALSEMDLGMEYVGRTTEGSLFQVGEDYVVIRAIVKAESFDPNDAVAEYEEKQAKAKEREEAKAKAKANK